MFDLAEAVPGPSTEKLGSVARDAGVVVIASLFERRAPGLYHNTAAVIDADGKVKGIYRKMHIPDDPAYYEKFYFTPGDLGFRAFDTKVGPIGTLVCWDQWYPEGARLTALQGANILLYPTTIGWHPAEKEQYGPQQLDAWTGDILVQPQEIERRTRDIPKGIKRDIEFATERVRRFALAQKASLREFETEVAPGLTAGSGWCRSTWRGAMCPPGAMRTSRRPI